MQTTNHQTQQLQQNHQGLQANHQQQTHHQVHIHQNGHDTAATMAAIEQEAVHHQAMVANQQQVDSKNIKLMH